jgi:hypothetical protein
MICYAQVDIDVKDITCFGARNGKATLTIATAPGPYKVRWKKGADELKKYDDRLVAAGLEKGAYSVTIEDKNRCMIERSFSISEPSKLKLTLDREELNIVFCEPWQPFYINATPSGGTLPYDCANCQQLISPPGGRYYFSVIDSNKCVAKAEIGVYEIKTHCSFDPNDIIGPEGVDSCRWMSAKDDFHYTIRFENDPALATSPAQLIFVEYPIDPLQHGFSLNIGTFGWGPYTFEAPANTNTFQTRLDLTNELGFYVDVLAGLNLNNNTIFWRFETIDPNTGLRPINPFIGFLPINDPTTGIGEGFVSFSIKPKNTAQTGDIIFAQADIIFDANDAIITNIWENKIDAVPPTSQLMPLPNTSPSNQIILRWSGSDDPGGSGIDFYRVFASENGNSFTQVSEDVSLDSFLFTGLFGATYEFYLQAFDRVGNKEVKSIAEESITILDERSLLLYSINPVFICQNDSFIIEWTSSQVDFIDIEYSDDNGINYYPVAQNIPSPLNSNLLYAGDFGVGDSLKIKISHHSDPALNSESPRFNIVQVPDVQAGSDIIVCYLDAVYLDASGANTYLWSMGTTLSDSTDDNPRVYANETTTYLLEGIDANGCLGMDAVQVTVNLPTSDTLDVDICLGDSIYGGGEYQNTSGVYVDTFNNIFGCDSMVTQIVNQIDPCVWNQGPYVYVDLDAIGARNGANWYDAYHDIQAALQTVRKYVDAKEIWIAEGEYKPGNLRTSTYEISDSMKLFGGFVGNEINKTQRPSSGADVTLSGEIGTTGFAENIYHVITIDTSCTDCLIDGLRITAGNANGTGINENLGAGILVYGKLDLMNVDISQNKSQTNGAVYLIGTAANLSMINSHIENNTNVDGTSFFNMIGTKIFIGPGSTVE